MSEFKQLLEPYAQKYADMTDFRELTDEQLAELQEAVFKPTSTNCWYATFHAAQILRGPLMAEIENRRFHSKQGNDNATP